MEVMDIVMEKVKYFFRDDDEDEALATAAPIKKAEETNTEVKVMKSEPVKVMQPVKKEKAPQSYLAVGTVFEGTLKCKGDIEIAGCFKGDITTDGVVVLRSDIESNVTAGNLNLCDCALIGNVIAHGTVTISKNSKISGNVTAKEVICSGEINGDLKVAETTALDSASCVNGNVLTGALSVAKGATIKGNIEVKQDLGK